MSKLPPGPNAPGLLTTIRWQRDLAGMMQSSFERYGDVWTMKLMGGAVFVMVSDPVLIGEIFTADESVLAFESGLARPLLGDRSVIVLRGEAHARARGMLAPLFRRERLQPHHAEIPGIAEREAATWPLNEPISLLPHLRTMTLNVMLTLVFGTAEGPAQEQVRIRMRELLAWGESKYHMVLFQAKFMRGQTVPRGFKERRDALRAVLLEEVRRRGRDDRDGARDDILSLLVRSDPDASGLMSETEIVDHLMTLLIQGHQSSANLLGWALERLLRNPEVFERLQTDLASSSGGEYLDAVIKETLRNRPPVPITTRRVVNTPYQLRDYVLDPGTIIAVDIFMLHRRPDVYPDPERFRPERFLEQPPSQYEWIPFGGGGHACFGAGLALDEAKIILRTLLQTVRLEPVDPGDEKIVRERVGLSPSSGTHVIVRERVPMKSEAVVA